MGWIIAIATLMIISSLINSRTGKISVAAGIVSTASLLLSLITGMTFFVTISKLCLIVIVVVVVIGLLSALFTH